ncbi:LysR family transcriptional regulator [Zeimonas arvi]|uniref:LysR family transcriptional regulator n=1 Tax=Zeimonas arvi TaxID=2498847 RepID=A0A5C8NTQ9_9BURK|nr:LysR family transcriptional regulator [Zeimonas arvi]TXL64124.1 LysR family transcriptional regulator [Zeimonas arvi]
MIETTSLRYFREVALQGSLRHAAERLFVAQSALSRQISALEEELGVALFERRARGMALTEAGRLLLQYADDSRARLEKLRGLIHEFEVLERGHVEIACVEGLLSGFMPDFVEPFLAEHPGLSLTVSAMGSQAVAEAVAEHRVDIGILFGQSPRRDLIELARMSQPLCAIVSPGHPLAARRACRLADAAAYRVVLPDRSFGIRQLIDRVRANGRLALNVALETNTLSFAWRMAERTDCVTFLPMDSVRAEVAARRLVAVPLEDALFRGTRVTLVASASRTLSAAAQRVAESLEARMSEGARRAGARMAPVARAGKRSRNQKAKVENQ